jgi:hypothetical protein
LLLQADFQIDRLVRRADGARVAALASDEKQVR